MEQYIILRLNIISLHSLFYFQILLILKNVFIFFLVPNLLGLWEYDETIENMVAGYNRMKWSKKNIWNKIMHKCGSA